LSKKVILITGGSRGLGAAFVKKLSDCKENTVYFTYSDPGADFEMAENSVSVLCDQKKEEQIIDCVSGILLDRGRIDVLVNNACTHFTPCDFLETDWGMFQELLDVNVKGAYLFTRETARAMKRQQGGKIINILSSYVMHVPPEKLSFYISTKYALAGLSKASAAELCKYGITVNMISPGMMETRLTDYLPAR
jgi:NAD(P)-dependent dehydrogenase (short-subunit alcohol dehydrogenase family)